MRQKQQNARAYGCMMNVFKCRKFHQAKRAAHFSGGAAHNIIFTGLVSRERARDILLASDVSLVLLRKSPLFETVIPSKLLEAFAAGCPAVVGVSGEAKRLVLEAGGGIPVEPENAEAVAAAIDQLATKPDMRTAMGAAAREYVHREFDRRTWATRYVDLIHGICRPAA